MKREVIPGFGGYFIVEGNDDLRIDFYWQEYEAVLHSLGKTRPDIYYFHDGFYLISGSDYRVTETVYDRTYKICEDFLNELECQKVLGNQEFQAEIFDFHEHEYGFDRIIAFVSDKYYGTIVVNTDQTIKLNTFPIQANNPADQPSLLKLAETARCAFPDITFKESMGLEVNAEVPLEVGECVQILLDKFREMVQVIAEIRKQLDVAFVVKED